MALMGCMGTKIKMNCDDGMNGKYVLKYLTVESPSEVILCMRKVKSEKPENT